MTVDFPFRLLRDEKVLFDSNLFLIDYVLDTKSSNIGLFGGGLFGGISAGKTRHAEDHFTKGITSHGYITNRRLVFFKSDYGIFSGYGKIREMFRDIPLEEVQGVYFKEKHRKKFKIEIVADKTFTIDFGDKHRNGEKWLSILSHVRDKGHSLQRESPLIEDPAQILKLRLAKGEITKEEYVDLLKLL